MGFRSKIEWSVVLPLIGCWIAMAVLIGALLTLLGE